MKFRELTFGLLALAFGLTIPNNGVRPHPLASRPAYTAKQSLPKQPLPADASLEQTVRRISSNLYPENARLYQIAGVSSLSTIDYFTFLGIPPESVLNYVRQGVFESSDIIKTEFSKGNISPTAKELFDYYNITHPERYDISIIDRLMLSMKGGENGRPGLFVFFDDEMLQKRVSEENAVLEFSENLKTGAMKMGYAGKFYKPDVSLMIFEMDGNSSLRDKVQRAKKKFNEYRIDCGVLLEGCNAFVYHSSDDSSDERILRIFSTRNDWDEGILVDAVMESDNLKLAEEYSEVGVNDYEMFKYLEMLGITPEKMTKRLTKREISRGLGADTDTRTFRSLLKDASEESSEIFDYYSIKTPWMLTAGLFSELKQNMKGIPKDGKPVSLVLLGHDYGPGFEIAQLEDLLDGYHVLIYEVSDDNSAIKTITEVGEKYGKIGLLWIKSHSGRDAIAFSGYYGKEGLSMSETEKINRISPYVGKNSIIVLDGCDTAKGGKEARNIANAIKQHTGAEMYGTPKQIDECVPETDEHGKVIKVICDGEEAIKF